MAALCQAFDRSWHVSGGRAPAGVSTHSNRWTTMPDPLATVGPTKATRHSSASIPL